MMNNYNINFKLNLTTTFCIFIPIHLPLSLKRKRDIETHKSQHLTYVSTSSLLQQRPIIETGYVQMKSEKYHKVEQVGKQIWHI